MKFKSRFDPDKVWMETTSGIKFDLLNPSPEMVVFDDIATALARLPRYCGHGLFPYPVAAHSLYVADLLAGTEYEACGLMHDATEPYTQDVTSPAKYVLRVLADTPESQFDDFEATIWKKAIAPRFNLPAELPFSVKQADHVAVLAERRALGFTLQRKSYNNLEMPTIPVKRWGSEQELKMAFTERARRLGLL